MENCTEGNEGKAHPGEPLTEASFSDSFVKHIARVCHEANRGICEAQGDKSQLPWHEAADWQRDSAIRGVRFTLANPHLGPAEQHEAWCKDKVLEGWKYGPVKAPETKEHPCLIRYEELPEFQKTKDYVFRNIVLAMCPTIPVVQ